MEFVAVVSAAFSEVFLLVFADFGLVLTWYSSELGNFDALPNEFDRLNMLHYFFGTTATLLSWFLFHLIDIFNS